MYNASNLIINSRACKSRNCDTWDREKKKIYMDPELIQIIELADADAEIII